MEENEISVMQSFEETMVEKLLIEELAVSRAEVFKNVVFEKKKRYYIEDLSERDYLLESTTPYQLKIGNTVFNEHAWTKLLPKVADYLISNNPDKVLKLTDFRCEWSNKEMFTEEKKTNFKELECGLFINCNHTALHDCWFLQDILTYFEVDLSTVYFLIHRPCGAEPKDVKEYILKRFVRGFKNHLQDKYDYDEERASKIVENIDKYLNPMLMKFSKSYTNFFLFDDNVTLYSYTNKVKEMIEAAPYKEESKKLLNRYLDLLIEYYKA